jgi:hypothetical protein
MKFDKLFRQASAPAETISDRELRKRAAEEQYNHRLRREPVGAAEINIGSERVQRV